ncbi:MAG: hypothetical protein ACR2O6_12620 [Ilumatobacteraceae bacterium]
MIPRFESDTSGRARDDRGAGTVAAIALIFAFTFLGLVWLARDVDRSISNRSAAQSIAFQAARSGAQSADVAGLREGESAPIDPGAARVAAEQTARTLFASYGVAGSITEINVDGDRVTVSVTITDAGRTVSGSGTVRAERTP